MTTRKCECYARASVTRRRNLFTRVFSCFQTAKSLEKTFKTTLRQNNTKIWAAYDLIQHFARKPDANL